MGHGEHVRKQTLVFAHVDHLIADIKGAQRSLEAFFDSLEQQLNVESFSSHDDADSSGDMEDISEWPMDEVNSIPRSDTVRNVFPAANTIATWTSQLTRHINVYSVGQWGESRIQDSLPLRIYAWVQNKKILFMVQYMFSIFCTWELDISMPKLFMGAMKAWLARSQRKAETIFHARKLRQNYEDTPWKYDIVSISIPS
ncbi:hypothetical protein BDV39DRAFT_208520 [Aspergillus sergii]|uniref:Uncharacterized protein n=1 Tax=Aspergillus sergii TaxID=1034303 RepID=A0A5N6WS21_9EURO|nr:hypothetical protein BDV39DRAFT_208520 [Aspergillus sergii]